MSAHGFKVAANADNAIMAKLLEDDPQKAEQMALENLEKCPYDDKAFLWYIKALIAQEKYDEALEKYRECSSLDSIVPPNAQYEALKLTWPYTSKEPCCKNIDQTIHSIFEIT